MTDNNDSTRYPPPPPERVERALTEMRSRRARRRRVRTLAGTTALAVVIAGVAFAVAGTNDSNRVRVVAPSSTSAPTTTSTTSRPTTTTATSTTSTSTQPTTTAPAAPTTAVITYEPFTATGAIDPSLHVTANVTGTCLTGESSRTYRCFGAGATTGIYDPCFAGPNGTSHPLVCPSDPTTGDVVQFTATSVTPEPPVTVTHPWAMQLAGGNVCLFVSAAWGGLGPYGCHSANAASQPADCRPPVESQPEWTTTCQDDMTDASPFTTTQVVKVWY